MSEFWRDIQLAVRRLAGAPLFTAFSVVTLALGIGITTAAYSILYGMLWRDPAIADPDRLLMIGRLIAWSDYRDLRDQQSTFREVAAHAEFSGSLAGNGTAELVRGEAVSGNYFQALGVVASIGRLIQPGDDESGASAAAVISAALWRSQFDADPNIVGTVVRMAGRPFEVVGVAPDRFTGIEVVAMRPVAVWISLEAARQAAPALGPPYTRGFDPGNRDTRWLGIIARLGEGRRIGDAEAEVAAIASRLDATAPLRLPPDVSAINTRNPQRTWVPRPALDRSRFANASEAGRVILAVPALVLLVACTNLANLVLSRGLSRRQEQSIRQALGASRWRLVRTPLLESGVVALLGGLGGTLVTWWLLRWATVTFEGTFGAFTAFRIDGRFEPAVAAAVAIAMLLALVVSGLAPALRLTRGDLHKSLTVDASANALLRWRGRGNLIALQVAVSVALFLLTALALRLLPAMQQAPGPGRNLDKAALVEVPFRWQQPDEARARQTIDAVVEEAGRVPGIEVAAASNLLTANLMRVTTPDRPFTPQVAGESADVVCGTPGLFRALDLPIRSGRAFDERDSAGAGAVVLLNEAAAKKLFAAPSDALGREIRMRSYFSRSSARGADDDVEALTVIGIVADSSLDRQGRPERTLYRPMAQHFDLDVAILTRSSTLDTSAMASVIRTAVRRADADVAIRYAGSAEALFRMQAVALGLATGVIGALATLALVLAMAGLYGVLSHVVFHRTREIGVRVALGADKGHITRLVLKDGIRPVVEGLVIGLGAAAVIRMILQPSFSQSISPFDLVATLAAVIPLAIAAGAACYLPARRAARVDPNVALRQL